MITDMKNAKIFSPLQLGRTTLKNRIAMAPMSMHYEATNGTVPKQLADIFVRRAEGGAGYVVIDAVTVDHKYWYIGKTTALDKDSLVPQFAAFAKRVSDAGSTLIPQIIHPGPESICALKGITPEFCVDEAIHGMLHHKTIIVPSAFMRLCTSAQKLLPTPLLMPIVARQQKKKLG